MIPSRAPSAGRTSLTCIRRARTRRLMGASMRTGRTLTRREAGFTMVELMIVIAIMLIIISIAAPIYRTSIIRAREAVLRDNLFTLRSLIENYTLDKQKAPQALEDLVPTYIREIPKDPFTGINSSWQVVMEDAMMAADQTAPGISD